MRLLERDKQYVAQILLDWLGPTKAEFEVAKRAEDFLTAGDIRSYGIWLDILAATVDAQGTKPTIWLEKSWDDPSPERS
jgi:hypothetical protein